MSLNPRQLEAFRLVMLRGSVTAAAQAMNVSQPAVSRLVRDLEARSGLTLFERHGNHLVPTPEATLLLAEVERHFAGLEAIGSFASELRHHRRGTLRIVAMPALAMGFLPRLVAQFIAGRELAEVYLHGMPSHLVIDAVASGQAEIGIAAAPPDRPGLRLEPLGAKAVLVVPRSHRLARQRVAGLHDLAGERMVTLAESTIFTAPLHPFLAETIGSSSIATPLSGIACSLVAAGSGVALVDPFAASEHVGRGIAVLAFEPAIDITVAVVTSANRRLSAVSQEFIAALRVHVADLSTHLAPPRRRARPLATP